MKRLLCLPLVLLMWNAAFTQGVFSNHTNSALQKVIQDYPNRFQNIKGDLLAENPQTTDYKSKVEIPGSGGCVLTQYSATKKEIYSWRAELFEEEDFSKTKTRFKDLYNQIRNTIVKIDGEKPLILNGAYQAPTEEKKFSSVMFQLLPGGGEISKLQVELSMQHMITGWKISLIVYEKESKDELQASVTEK